MPRTSYAQRRDNDEMLATLRNVLDRLVDEPGIQGALLVTLRGEQGWKLPEVTPLYNRFLCSIHNL